MSAKTGAFVKSNINTTLAQNGLFWLGVATGVNQITTDTSEVRSGLGLGPRQRIHLKNDIDVKLMVSSIIPKHIDDAAIDLVFKSPNFNHLQYYMDLLEPSTQILTREDNKAIMLGYNIVLAANSPIIGSFTNVVFQADRAIYDNIEEYADPNDIPFGTGNEVVAYGDVELPVMCGGQFMPGVTSIEFSTMTELKPLSCPGGIYGYYYAHPFGINITISIYEKTIEEYQNFFNDVQNLSNIIVGPFTGEKAKLTSYSPGVSTTNVKQITATFVAKNLLYTP